MATEQQMEPSVEPARLAPPETSRLQHTVRFLCILACMVMLLFYL